MRALVQRVSRAEVRVAGEVRGAIAHGLLVLVGVTHDDGEAAAEWIAAKIAGLRVFPDERQRMNRNVGEAGGAVLLVPQFTLFGDTRRGHRPDFVRAAPPEQAAPLIDRVAARLEQLGLRVERGVFGAHMEVESVNDGPVTLPVESPGPGAVGDS